MFGFIKKYFQQLIIFIKLSKYNSVMLYSMINQAHKLGPKIMNFNSNEPVFYPFSIKTSKCSGSCNNINDPYAKICVPGAVKRFKR